MSGPQPAEPSWQIKITFMGGDVDWFDLGADEEVARDLYRLAVKELNRTKNDPAAAPKHVQLGARLYVATDIMMFELVPSPR